jgi:hypothetical protein
MSRRRYGVSDANHRLRSQHRAVQVTISPGGRERHAAIVTAPPSAADEALLRLEHMMRFHPRQADGRGTVAVAEVSVRPGREVLGRR